MTLIKKPALADVIARRSALRPAVWSICTRGGEQSHDAIWSDGPFGEQRVCVVENTDLQPGVATFLANARADVDFLLALVHDQEQEIARLRAGGCARDQGLTQFCAEAAALAARVAELEGAAASKKPTAPCLCALFIGFAVYKDNVCDRCGGYQL